MKYIVVLGDGMADEPCLALGGKTPLDIAKKPYIDSLAKKGEVGLCKTVPDGMKAGSDVANLSVMGFDPLKNYTGRSPIEAASMGIALKDSDVAIRCNLVTLSGGASYEDMTMADYSAGEISTEEAAELIKAVDEALGSQKVKFYAGISYRHCAVLADAETGDKLTPPHDISDKKIAEYLPKGINAPLILELMKKSYGVLKDHPVNKKRVALGKNPANSIWLWGEGRRLSLESFERAYGLKGAVISAVDLVKGIGVCADMKVIEVAGATGNLDTNFEGKAKACFDALESCDYVYLHMEAPDECGHQGDCHGKIKAIEYIDNRVVKYLVESLEAKGIEYRMLIMPDHPTPLALKTHTPTAVPFVLYDSRCQKAGAEYNEKNAEASGLYIDSGVALAKKFLEI